MKIFETDDTISSVDDLLKDAFQRSQETCNGNEKPVAPENKELEIEK